MSSMKLTNDSTARRTHVRRPFTTALAVLALAGSAVLGACDGSNLFSGETGVIQQGPPLVTSIVAPASIDEGATLDVRIKAIAPRGMDVVTVRYRRALNDEVQRSFQGRSDTVTVDATIAVPAEAADSILVIEAFASDVAGRVSPVVSHTVRIIDSSAPNVSATLTPTTASMGDTVVISVSAKDRFGLSAMGYAIVTAAGDTIRGGPSLFAVSGTQRDTSFIVVLPDSLQPSTLSVVGIAVNSSQLRGVSSPLALTVVDQRPPAITILRPRQNDSHPLSDSLLVRVHVADSGGISSVRMYGEAVRGDSLQNTTIVLRYLAKTIPLPQAGGAVTRDTILMRYLLPTNVGVSETVRIIVQATDMSGNMSADTISIIDGPSVEIVNPTSGTAVALNSSLLVQIRAVDRVAGLDSVRVMVSGVRTETIVLRNLAPLQALDTTIVINTGGTQGQLRLEPHVWNIRAVGGSGQPVTVDVTLSSVTDSEPPRVLRQVQSNTRVELDDSIRVVVRATDGSGSGVQRMGIVAIVIPDTDLLPRRTLYRTSESFSPALSGTPERVFNFTLGELYNNAEMEFPRRFNVQVHAFAVDAAGNCGASVQDTYMSAPCEVSTVNGVQYYTARGAAPAQVQLTATDGQSIRVPGGGTIADAVVDADRRRVYLSNITNNRVDIFHIGPDSFDIAGARAGACSASTGGLASCRGVVGAAPWGMFINNRGDSLIVANSGGTNISFLPLDGANYMREDINRRLLTPNVVLWQLNAAISEGFIRITKEFFDFSDRPQFVAQHRDGPLLYSTVPTGAAGAGTLRFADTNPNPAATDDLPESYILFGGNSVREAEDSWALANIDSITIVRNSSGDDVVILYDHQPGYYAQPGRPGITLQSDPLPVFDAVVDLQAKGSDVAVYAGAWNIGAVSLSDTTFIAASTDRSTIAFGEGATAPTGRIILCCDIQPGPPLKIGVSDGISVVDLVNNASERVFGLGLNANGTLGVARGEQAAYYFTPDLRLQGEFRSGIAGGAGGAALHPSHSAALESGDNALSFVATPNNSIKIIDTAHFYQRGEIHIRDNVVGPLRTVIPAAAENAGLTPTDPGYIVVKLVGVTSGNNVVIVNVRRRDIL